MSLSSIAPAGRSESRAESRRPQPPARISSYEAPTYHLSTQSAVADVPHRHAELFYLQKQIYSQTPMVIVLEDGERLEGCIEWYDRNSLKIRGRARTLVYKSAIKYMYKLGENGQ